MRKKEVPGQARLSVDARQLARRRRQMQSAQAALCAQTAQACLPYMPKVTGALIASQRVDSVKGEIHVDVRYAGRAYYSSSGVGRPTGALRGPRWFARMKADKTDALLQQVKHNVGVK